MSTETEAREPRPDPTRGVFDTMLVRDGRVQALDLHLERLAAATRDLYAAGPEADLADRVHTTAATLTGAHRLRIDVIPAGTGLTYTITTHAADTGPRTQTLEPFVVPGGIGPYKWRDRRLLERLTTPTTTPLILDATGELLEAAFANVWVVEGTRILTPPADGRLLPGVTRTLLLELAAPTLELTPVEEPIDLARASASDAIILTSSIRHALPATLKDDGPPADGSTATALGRALATLAWG